MNQDLDPVEIKAILKRAFDEDVREGDHTSLACIGPEPRGKARLLIKEAGILAGVEVAKAVFAYWDPELEIEVMIPDGQRVDVGEEAFYVLGSALSILTAERIALNLMQRMSGIASKTARYVAAVQGTNATVLDTRKTIPGIRYLEKLAVTIGGGANHRMGLYDMMMIKDNHVDFCGGITKAIHKANEYIAMKELSIGIEIETRSLDEVREVLDCGQVQRIMLDNFTPAKLEEAVQLIDGRFETEASGGITLETIRSYALTGVDFISSGALTHSAVAMDMSLKAVIQK